MAEENKLQVFPVGITEKEIKKIAEEVGGGTEVVANPEVSGDEPDLTSIGIAGANYKIAAGGGSGGTKLYLHALSTGSPSYQTIYVISTIATDLLEASIPNPAVLQVLDYKSESSGYTVNRLNIQYNGQRNALHGWYTYTLEGGTAGSGQQDCKINISNEYIPTSDTITEL